MGFDMEQDISMLIMSEDFKLFVIVKLKRRRAHYYTDQCTSSCWSKISPFKCIILERSSICIAHRELR